MKECVLSVGLDHIPLVDDVYTTLVGDGFCNVRYIQRTTGAVVEVIGRGSAEIDRETGQASKKPLHVIIRHVTEEELEFARSIVSQLLDNVRDKFKHHPKSDLIYCKYCELDIRKELFDYHVEGAMHKQRYASCRSDARPRSSVTSPPRKHPAIRPSRPQARVMPSIQIKEEKIDTSFDTSVKKETPTQNMSVPANGRGNSCDIADIALKPTVTPTSSVLCASSSATNRSRSPLKSMSSLSSVQQKSPKSDLPHGNKPHCDHPECLKENTSPLCERYQPAVCPEAHDSVGSPSNNHRQSPRVPTPPHSVSSPTLSKELKQSLTNISCTNLPSQKRASSVRSPCKTGFSPARKRRSNQRNIHRSLAPTSTAKPESSKSSLGAAASPVSNQEFIDFQRSPLSQIKHEQGVPETELPRSAVEQALGAESHPLCSRIKQEPGVAENDPQDSSLSGVNPLVQMKGLVKSERVTSGDGNESQHRKLQAPLDWVPSLEPAMSELRPLYLKQLTDSHRSVLLRKALADAVDVKPSTLINSTTFCKVCGKEIGELQALEAHWRSKEHAEMYLRVQLNVGLVNFVSLFGDTPFVGINTYGGRRLAVSCIDTFNKEALPSGDEEHHSLGYREVVVLAGKICDYNCEMCRLQLDDIYTFAQHVTSRDHAIACMRYLWKKTDDTSSLDVATVIWPWPDFIDALGGNVEKESASTTVNVHEDNDTPLTSTYDSDTPNSCPPAAHKVTSPDSKLDRDTDVPGGVMPDVTSEEAAVDRGEQERSTGIFVPSVAEKSAGVYVPSAAEKLAGAVSVVKTIAMLHSASQNNTRQPDVKCESGKIGSVDPVQVVKLAALISKQKEALLRKRKKTAYLVGHHFMKQLAAEFWTCSQRSGRARELEYGMTSPGHFNVEWFNLGFGYESVELRVAPRFECTQMASLLGEIRTKKPEVVVMHTGIDDLYKETHTSLSVTLLAKKIVDTARSLCDDHGIQQVIVCKATSLEAGHVRLPGPLLKLFDAFNHALIDFTEDHPRLRALALRGFGKPSFSKPLLLPPGHDRTCDGPKLAHRGLMNYESALREVLLTVKPTS